MARSKARSSSLIIRICPFLVKQGSDFVCSVTSHTVCPALWWCFTQNYRCRHYRVGRRRTKQAVI